MTEVLQVAYNLVSCIKNPDNLQQNLQEAHIIEPNYFSSDENDPSRPEYITPTIQVYFKATDPF